MFCTNYCRRVFFKTLAAHGGNHYKEVKSIAYQKKINHFDASGVVLDTVIENHTIDFVNSTSQFSWKELGNDFIAIQNKDSVTLQINGVHTKDTSTILKIKKSLKAATYVFWQPLKLVDPNAVQELKGVTTLFNGWQVHVLEVQYPNSDDRWYFYFDTKTFLLKATGVFFKKRYSLIVNDLQEKNTGLNLNAKRTSFFTNSAFVPRRINTQYQYEIISLSK